ASEVKWPPEHDIRLVMTTDNMIFDYIVCDVEPFIENGSTLVPLRAIAEEFGYDVDGSDMQNQIQISNGETIIKMAIGSDFAEVNGEPIVIPVAPRIVNNRTMVPLRFVSEQLGLYVVWGPNMVEGKRYIWITRVELLILEDFVNIYQDYETIYHEDGHPDPIYSLHEGATTSRGIGLGSRVEDIVSAYGDPHRHNIEHPYGIRKEYFLYYGPGIPGTDNYISMSFILDGDVAIQVEANYR
ncbi:MAG: copper amine oxidase N-terminal domain-containing protein, partial [Clostridiales bacterium]|nr:copper amine oxidase N-terminal domain-containing protein [Clostridiales bacterium]